MLITKKICNISAKRYLNRSKIIITPINQASIITTLSYFNSTSLSKPTQQSTLYTQRAYTPSTISQQIISHLPEPSQPLSHPQTILHQLNLYYSKILPFDYDYYCQSLKRLIPYQQRLSVNDLLMVLELATEYKIDLEILHRHFENELFCKVYLNMKKEINQYDQKQKKQVEGMYKMLEKGSKDHFQMLDQKFLKEQQQQQETNQNNQEQLSNNNESSSKIVSKPIYNAEKRKNKSKHIPQQTFNRITNAFLQINSRNIQFNKLLLQTYTIRLDQSLQEHQSSKQPRLLELSPQSLLQYTRLTIHFLQSLLSQYTSTQKQKMYTHRSIKNIYKLQNFYYFEINKMIEDNKLLQKVTNEQFIQFVEVISGLPIRRRSFRKAIGGTMIQEAKRRNIECDRLMGFFELSRFDNKLLEYYEQKVNYGKELPLNPKQIQQDKQIQKQVNKQQVASQLQSKQPLTPQIIQQSQQSSQQQFKLPRQLFRKVTKKKSKSKNKKFVPQEEVEIDLTQEGQELDVKDNKGENIDKEEVDKKSDSLKERVDSTI